VARADPPLRSGVARNHVSLIGPGHSGPSVRTLFQLCGALDTTPSELLTQVDCRMKVPGQGGDTAGA
jgi:transcriptional regulator with XRE-family HTH domain